MKVHGPLKSRVAKVAFPFEPDKLDENERAALPVSVLEWSVRTTSCFKKEGIRTFGDLAKRTEAELLQVTNFGQISLREVTGVLSMMGLALRDQPPTPPPPVPQTMTVSFGIDENPATIESHIIHDLEQYVSGLARSRKIIFCARYGFRQSVRTLQEVGNEVGLTRERIRQIQAKIQKNLRHMGMVDKNDLFRYLQNYRGSSVHKLYPRLDALFVDNPLVGKGIKSIKNDNLIEFLEDYTGVARGTYQVAEKLLSDISIEKAHDLFLEIPSPLDIESFKQELQSIYGLPESSLDHAIRHLEAIRKCRITEDGIVPENLPRVRGVTHVLLNFPDGCHWKTVNGILAQRKITKPFISRGGLPRVTADATFASNDGIYLYGRGIYRHRKFLDLGAFNIDDILETTARIIKNSDRQVMGLKEMFADITSQLNIRISFWDLRHVLKEYGSRRGIYFQGISGTHTLALREIQQRVTNAQIILNVFKEQNKALSFDDVQTRLKSCVTPSIISLQLSDLLESNALIRIAPGTYCLPEVAFGNADATAIKNRISDYLSDYETIEHDFLREQVNAELNLKQSKYFYNAFVKYYAAENGWHHSIDLASARTLQFRRAIDVLRAYLKSEETFMEDRQSLLASHGFSHLTISRYARTHLKIPGSPQ